MHMTVGVGTGRRRHQAAVYGPAAERIMGQVGFAVDRAGFDEFRGYLERLAPQPDQLVIGLEATGQYHLTLVEYLVGYQVARLNPLQAAQFRRSQGKRAKTDRLDAASFRPLPGATPAAQPVSSQTLVEARELTRFRAELVEVPVDHLPLVAARPIWSSSPAYLSGATGPHCSWPRSMPGPGMTCSTSSP